MISLQRRDAVAWVAIMGLACAMAFLRTTEGQSSSSFSFHISSRRNATGHCQVKAIFNIPEPLHQMSNDLLAEQESCFDVEQNINNVENRTIIQLISTFTVHSTEPPPGYELVPRLGWYRLHLTPLPWEHARKSCESEGAHLAIVNSQEEADALKKIFATAPDTVPSASWSHDAYMGFSYGKDGLYRTIFGQTLKEAGFDVWHPGQPDKLDEHCGGISKSQGKLANLPCGSYLVYFCEKKL